MTSIIRNQPQIFTIPVEGAYLVYSPIQHLAGLMDYEHISELANVFINGNISINSPLSETQKLISTSIQIIDGISTTSHGQITHPLFLGFITTWQCNLACLYCDFTPFHTHHSVMTMDVAKVSLDAYFDILASSQIETADIQFFGGEPFLEKELTAFIISYARKVGQEKKIRPIFEATTNGFFSKDWCQWVASNFNCITVSLDGLEQTQNRFRPHRSGGQSYSRVLENAKIIATSGVELIIRSCITDDNVNEMEAFAGWIADQITCDAVCFETLIPSNVSHKNHLKSPDPITFAKNFCLAEKKLMEYGIQAITSGTDIQKPQSSFCPLGKDALIITPDGRINACYLADEKWQKADLNLNIGHIENFPNNRLKIFLDQSKINNVRKIGNTSIPMCQKCFCRYSCAGGCPVNHHNALVSNKIDEVCIQTRLITIAKLLLKIGAIEQWEHFVSNMDQYASVINEEDFELKRVANAK